MDINITILVGNKTAPGFNFGLETLDYILILHLQNGKDDFVSSCLRVFQLKVF